MNLNTGPLQKAKLQFACRRNCCFLYWILKLNSSVKQYWEHEWGIKWKNSFHWHCLIKHNWKGNLFKKGKFFIIRGKRQITLKKEQKEILSNNILYWGTSWQNVSASPESLHELEGNDLDALMADLMADLNATEEKLATEIECLKAPSASKPDFPPPPKGLSIEPAPSHISPSSAGSRSSNVSAPVPSAASSLAPPPPSGAKLTTVSEPTCSNSASINQGSRELVSRAVPQVRRKNRLLSSW